MRKIYLVWGEDGEYDDKTEWVICAFSKEEDAKDRARRLNTLVNSEQFELASIEGKRQLLAENEETNFAAAYGNPTYSCGPVELHE